MKPLKMNHLLFESELEIQRLEMDKLRAELAIRDQELKLANSRIEFLTERAETLEDYINNSIDVIHAVNTSGEFLYVSGAWEKYFGLPVSAAIGKAFTEFIVSEDRKICSEYVQCVLKTGQSAKSPMYRVILSDGSLRWIITNGKSYVDRLGNLIFVGVSHDITELLNAEKALRDSESRFSLSMDATSDGLWDWEIQSERSYFSPGYFRMLGYEPGEFETSIRNRHKSQKKCCCCYSSK